MTPFRHLRQLLTLVWTLLALALLPGAAAAQTSTMVRLHTTQGPLDIKLLDSQAPTTVANFLTYVRSGAYVDSLVHRSARTNLNQPFVIQGGGFLWPSSATLPIDLPTRPAITNEFAANRSNVRGTVAMARVGGQVNSATSQWFVNMRDDNNFLDGVDGGFTVFGRMTTPGLVIAEKIALLPRVNIGGALNEMPVNEVPSSIQTLRPQAVLVTLATEFPPLASQRDFDRVFNCLEALFPQLLAPSQPQTGSAAGFDFRYYATSAAYLGAKDGQIYYLSPAGGPNPILLGSVADLLPVAIQQGY